MNASAVKYQAATVQVITDTAANAQYTIVVDTIRTFAKLTVNPNVGCHVLNAKIMASISSIIADIPGDVPIYGTVRRVNSATF
jgi:hypothetical protein